MDLKSHPARKVIAVFTDACQPLFAVGGCVRDALVGVQPKDFDFTTPASVDQIRELLEPLGTIVDTGAEFGTIAVVIDGEAFEVTTHRKESYCFDSRKPTVEIVGVSLKEDLARRDLTFNAIALDTCSGELVDPFEGVADLRDRICRTPGDPEVCFDEDPLRIIRVVRFAARFGASIAPETAAAMHAKRSRLFDGTVSVERVESELDKMFVSEDVTSAALKLIVEFDLSDSVFGVGIDVEALLAGSTLVGRMEVRAAAVRQLPVSDRKAFLEGRKLSKQTVAVAVEAAAIADQLSAGPLSDVVALKICRAAKHAASPAVGFCLVGCGAGFEEFMRVFATEITQKLPISGTDLTDRGLSGRDVGKALKAVEVKFCESKGKLSAAAAFNVARAVT
ncbi:MAG: CCA tRNA nucleotidyltransferase [Ilumatobacter sp.]|nr:CCA tRNA nucleotidyltransferase [Ilumatobacter sp.]